MGFLWLNNYKHKFINFEKGKIRFFTFRGGVKTQILGSRIIALGDKDANAKNVLFIENMSHNLLSLIQMCEQGHNLIF